MMKFISQFRFLYIFFLLFTLFIAQEPLIAKAFYHSIDKVVISNGNSFCFQASDKTKFNYFILSNRESNEAEIYVFPNRIGPERAKNYFSWDIYKSTIFFHSEVFSRPTNYDWFATCQFSALELYNEETIPKYRSLGIPFAGGAFFFNLKYGINHGSNPSCQRFPYLFDLKMKNSSSFEMYTLERRFIETKKRLSKLDFKQFVKKNDQLSVSLYLKDFSTIDEYIKEVKRLTDEYKYFDHGCGFLKWVYEGNEWKQVDQIVAPFDEPFHIEDFGPVNFITTYSGEIYSLKDGNFSKLYQLADPRHTLYIVDKDNQKLYFIDTREYMKSKCALVCYDASGEISNELDSKMLLMLSNILSAKGKILRSERKQ